LLRPPVTAILMVKGLAPERFKGEEHTKRYSTIFHWVAIPTGFTPK
jgi:hypothetical protein